MSIKIIPEKVANIDSHRTRKKITESTYASKDLIAKAVNLSTTIEVANKQLHKLNLPYLKDTQLVFYSPTKIIVQSDKEILKSKIKELHNQFITKLNQTTLFSRVEKIELIVDYSNHQTKKADINPPNKVAKKALEKIKLEINKLRE
ncbi:hypothetical protein [Francisella philomiragia]|nr:hypothetical protein [Francisella philomiragia]AJI54475.1 hypothetical protein LA56_162 [Francisella philomiragia]MBK2093879.1 hypothetical protein [Francisella philomiragia]MBK2252634.1 hypothetical protein [Francisella philomiragia]MBK2256349.1 hypothetical protein [Francisella philomiragia]MBK2269007.1 hypothetical protein [Francisella philomiragia]